MPERNKSDNVVARMKMHDGEFEMIEEEDSVIDPDEKVGDISKSKIKDKNPDEEEKKMPVSMKSSSRLSV